MYGNALEKVTSIAYLGSTITTGGQLDKEIDQRINWQNLKGFLGSEKHLE